MNITDAIQKRTTYLRNIAYIHNRYEPVPWSRDELLHMVPRFCFNVTSILVMRVPRVEPVPPDTQHSTPQSDGRTMLQAPVQ